MGGRRGLIVAVIFTAFINILKFATPLFLLQVLDRVPESRSVGTLVMLTIAALIAVLAAVMLDAIRGRMIARWAAWIGAQFGPRLVREGLAATRLGHSPSTQNGSATSPRLRRSSRGRRGPGSTFSGPRSSSSASISSTRCSAASPRRPSCSRASRLDAGGDDPQRPARRARGLGEAGDSSRPPSRHLEAVGAHAMTGNLAERWWRSAAVRLDERERSERRAAVFRR